MNKKRLFRLIVLLMFVGLIPMIISKVVTNITVQTVMLPIQEMITGLTNQYQVTSQEALDLVSDQSVQNFLLETKLLYGRHVTTFIVLLTHAVSTVIGGIVGNIVCEGPLSDWCTDGLLAICDGYDETTADIAETILVGIAMLLCVYLSLRAKLSAFL